MRTTSRLCFSILVLAGLSYGKPTDLEAKYGGYVLEGDMIVSDDVLKTISKEDGDLLPQPEKEAERVPGQPFVLPITQFNSYRWPNKIVYYTIASDLKCSNFFWKCFFSGAEDVIKKAIQHWEQHTCIRFQQRETERDYIEFIDDGLGKCYSSVGRQGGRQVLALGKFCRKTGIAIHEIGHALGFFHEQSRPDRDNYVEIIDGNIQSGAEVNFLKYKYSQINDLGFPYDYQSIMHYASNAFSKWPWQKTIQPKQRGVEIGQREELSRGDIEEMNKYYEC